MANGKYPIPAFASRLMPNRWDFIAFPLILCLLVVTERSFHQTLVPLSALQSEPVSLSPTHLPEYGLRTTLRMLAAMLASLLFTLTYGTLAAKSRRAEKVLVPILDILQSVPVLGYISFTVTFFLALFPGRVLGAELAAIFAIFTSQAWNMTFSFYQSLRTLPRDLVEVSQNLRLTSWQRFWKLEVPFALPGLIWNMMMSMSGGWFFVVASEAITVGDRTITLPGIGAYLSTAIDQRQIGAVLWVIVAMSVIILAYDQLMFRPLVAWADKYRMEDTAGADAPESWLLNLIRRTHLIQRVLQPFGQALASFVRQPWSMPLPVTMYSSSDTPVSRVIDRIYDVVIALIGAYGAWRVIRYVGHSVDLGELLKVLGLAMLTMVRVVVLIAVASVVWVPLGVLIGLRPRLAEAMQPLAQFMAAFPANLFFPIFVVLIVRWHGNPDLWLSPLIVLGTQWYILFNVIAGASAFPNDYREAATNFQIRGWQWWRKIILPGIFPYYITGAITASGGAWNASIVAEAVSWGDTHLHAHGLGAYIAENTAAANYPRILLGIAVMSFFVVCFNRLVWRPLYAIAETRLRLN